MNGTTQTPTKLAPAAREAREERDQRMEMMHNFDESPYTIAWEVTRACAYACAHCRADAQHKRDPRELDTAEGMRLIDMLAGFGTRPILVLTGGDPLMRRDLFEFARYADEKGLRVSLTPTATALPTRARMREAREAGIRRVAFSLDAADPEVHDRFRGFQGSFDRTFKGIENALAEGLPIQVNTTMCALNADQFEKLVPLLESVEVVQWSVFFLVPVGRGKQLEMLSPEKHEDVLERLYELNGKVSFDIKATASPHYRRIVREHSGPTSGAGFHFADGLDRPEHAKGVNDARGFMFVSHIGEVMPSGFLPISAGNVREEDPVAIYRDSPLFRELRDPEALKGKCARCEFREICGGSRARAYAVTGDCLESDPSCPYQP
ncbi:MAG TPA: TIGR04053 family radical SAM/SPASM domain-containing protein [Solirubrobacteraceae bacterium]|nr:TIGR04053 family radical SAM/SPASM domain-containing protein [Solirubrobacteraceae bacterium]